MKLGDLPAKQDVTLLATSRTALSSFALLVMRRRSQATEQEPDEASGSQHGRQAGSLHAMPGQHCVMLDGILGSKQHRDRACCIMLPVPGNL